MFEYPKPFTPELTDDNPIFCANYSASWFEFYIGGEWNIRVWNSRIGKPVWEIRNCMTSVITYVTFDKDHWKIVVGDHDGNIKMFDILSGICTNQVPSEDRHTEEISFIAYAGDDCNLVTCSWDKSIKIFKDGTQIELLRQKQNSH